MFLMNSGVRGNGDSKKSLRSTARLLTFHLPNSLIRNNKSYSWERKKVNIYFPQKAQNAETACSIHSKVDSTAPEEAGSQQNLERTTWIPSACITIVTTGEQREEQELLFKHVLLCSTHHSWNRNTKSKELRSCPGHLKYAAFLKTSTQSGQREDYVN